MDAEARATAGISDRLLRLSVGIESARDLVADLERALRAAAEAGTDADSATRSVWGSDLVGASDRASGEGPDTATATPTAQVETAAGSPLLTARG